MVLARQLNIWCGAYKIAWNTLEGLNNLLRIRSLYNLLCDRESVVEGHIHANAVPTIFQRTEAVRMRSNWTKWSSIPCTLMLLSVAHARDAARTQDKVFAIIGLLQKEIGTDIVVDVSLSPGEVFEA